MADVSDPDLLDAYVQRREGGAFAVLVERHANMVYAAAVRQTGNAEEAEDVAQAVFVLLARRAARVPPEAVAGWLLTATRLTARTARRAAARRERHESRSPAMPSRSPDPAVAAAAADLSRVLDAALATLPDADRTAVAVRYLQGRPVRDVAASLGVSEAAAQKRLARALDRLRRAPGLAGISPAALAGTAIALPPHFVASTTEAALGAPIGTTPAVQLAHEVTRNMTRRKFIVTSLTVAGSAVAAVAIAQVAQITPTPAERKAAAHGTPPATAPAIDPDAGPREVMVAYLLAVKAGDRRALLDTIAVTDMNRAAVEAGVDCILAERALRQAVEKQFPDRAGPRERLGFGDFWTDAGLDVQIRRLKDAHLELRGEEADLIAPATTDATVGEMPEFVDGARRTDQGWKLDWGGLVDTPLARRQMEWEERHNRRRAALYQDLREQVMGGRINSAAEVSDAVQAFLAAEEPRPR